MLEVRNLVRRFGDFTAVNNVSFEVPRGSFTGFVGGNGAGKTTTMRMIMGLSQITDGEVLWAGQPITSQIRSQIGFMPEERGLYPKQPVLRQLIYIGELHGLTRSQARQQGAALLSHFGLGDRVKDKLETLSLGNQQRVQIAAAVIGSPVGLVLDEPFSGLDPDAVDEMVAILSKFNADGIPVLFSSHQLDLVERLCDHIVILSSGNVVASGSVASLKEHAGTFHRIVTDHDLGWLRQTAGVEVIDVDGPRARVRFESVEAEQAVLRAALERGPVHAFGPVDRSLSEIYREVTR